MFHGPSQQTVKKEFLKLFQIFLKQDLVGGQGQGNGRDGGGVSQTMIQMSVS